MQLSEFYDLHERESWQGLSTAFKAGVKARMTGAPCGYVRRQDFRDAWQRGYDAADKHLKAGGSIEPPAPLFSGN